MLSCLVNFNPEHRRSKIPALPERARLHLHRSVPHFTPLFPLSRVSPLFPVASALFCTFLHPPKTQFFSYPSALFHKNKRCSYFQRMLFPDPNFFRIRISQISNRGSR